MMIIIQRHIICIEYNLAVFTINLSSVIIVQIGNPNRRTFVVLCYITQVFVCTGFHFIISVVFSYRNNFFFAIQFIISTLIRTSIITLDIKGNIKATPYSSIFHIATQTHLGTRLKALHQISIGSPSVKYFTVGSSKRILRQLIVNIRQLNRIHTSAAFTSSKRHGGTNNRIGNIPIRSSIKLAINYIFNRQVLIQCNRLALYRNNTTIYLTIFVRSIFYIC